jgi:hypothetical protein
LVWKLLKLIIISGVISIKTLLLDTFGDRVQNEGLENGLKDLLIPLHGYEMPIGLATSVDKCSFTK